MKIVVLATDCETTWMLVNSIRLKYPNLTVGLERPISRLQLLRSRLKSQGAFVVFGQLLFMCYIPLLRSLTIKRIRSLLEKAEISEKKVPDLAIVKFSSVNTEECRNWLIALNPDLVVINGTRIISSRVLSACSARFLNIHCGITPAYRGVHGGYWALAQRDSCNAGVTVHVVDAGIDTGDIVYQESIQFDSADNFVTYPIRQYIVAIPMLMAAIHDATSGSLKTFKRHDLVSAIWYHPTIWNYFYTLLRYGVR